MGLMDRDYMHEKHRQRPFSPPPERFSTLSMVLIFIVALFALYTIADWKLNQRAAELAGKQTVETTAATVQQPTAPPAQQLPLRPTYQNTPEATPGTHVVTKCVVNGKTSYGDGSCTQGATSTQVTTRANHNLMAAVRPEVVAVAQTEEPVGHAIVVAQNGTSAAAAAKKAECQYLNAEIERLDAMGRQPQSPQMFDWITRVRHQMA